MGFNQERITAKEYKKLISGRQGKTKYNNKKTVVNGITFDSIKEANRYCELVILEKAGRIQDLKLQVPFILVPKNKNGNQIKYVADFVYWNNEENREVVEDVKGVKTPVYKLKKRLMSELGYKILET